jgi:hypothetical protein
MTSPHPSQIPALHPVYRMRMYISPFYSTTIPGNSARIELPPHNHSGVDGGQKVGVLTATTAPPGVLSCSLSVFFVPARALLEL